MKRGTERILTTHTGSLPRPPDLLALLRARESHAAWDPRVLEKRVSAAVGEAVRMQVAAGLDVVNDGEMGKVSYSTYVKDRLTGFEGGESAPLFAADLAEFPAFAVRSGPSEDLSLVKRPSCVGPVAYRDLAAARVEFEDLKNALQKVNSQEAFVTAASPGVIAFFLENKFYPTHEAYIRAIADAMKIEYDAICAAGFILQIDCPDLAVSRHCQFSSLSTAEFRKVVELHIEALNHALADVAPERARLHLCWGNYEGPHHHDVALQDILDLVLKARPMGLSYEAANPRHGHEWAVFKKTRLPDGKVLIPGVIDTTTNFIEHPELVAQRICNLANVVGRENVIAGTDCGFGTFAGVGRVDTGIAWAKMKAGAEGARLASSQLW